MSTLLNLGRDLQGNASYSPPTAINKYSATLATSTATSITVPSNAKVWVAAFSYQPGADVWVDLTGATAAVPAGSTLAATTAELNPSSRTVYAGGTISMITASSTAADVGVSLYVIS